MTKANTTPSHRSKDAKRKPLNGDSPANKTPSKKARKDSPRANVVKLTSAANDVAPDFIVRGANDKALFTLTVYRGEGMCLIAMNWKKDTTPPDNFVGFAIEYQEPDGIQFYPLLNRLSFPDSSGNLNANTLSSRLSPFQKFRWVHFPRNADKPGIFTYRVSPVFMNDQGVLSYGDYQQAGLELEAETYPQKMNICFTRGFISSQAFVDKYGTNGGVGTILPKTANTSIDFPYNDPKQQEALAWMGFEARSVILNALDAAIADESASVLVAAYDFNEPEIVDRLKELKTRLKIIIDDSGSHKGAGAAESKAAAMLEETAGEDNVQRQHMGGLQHNKILVVNGDSIKIAIGGSTNFSWRGIYVQNNNAVALQGAKAVEIFTECFNNLWASPNKTAGFNDTVSADWIDLEYEDINAKITFSPHNKTNAKLDEIGDAISSADSSLFYSLAFLYETEGPIRDAIEKVTAENNVYVAGLSDKTVGGLDIQLANGNQPIAFPANLIKNVPPPFQHEATGGNGTRLHHKFVVIDFNKPTARVYTGSYNFSNAADQKNGENLFWITDQRVATSYMIEAVTMFDHYQFRDLSSKSKTSGQALELKKPPTSGEKPWWDSYWTDPSRIRDRELFGN